MDRSESRYEDGVEKSSKHSSRDRDRKKSNRGEYIDVDNRRIKDKERSRQVLKPLMMTGPTDYVQKGS